MQAGILRHVITIQRPVVAQDELGQPSTTFEDVLTNVRAAIVPMSGREYITSKQVAADITTRITIRRYANSLVEPTCRILHTIYEDSPPTVEVYDIMAVLPDPVSGMRYLTLMCAQRIAEGWRRGS